MVKFDISEDQREVLSELLRVATDAHVALLPHDPELASELAERIRETQENFGVDE